MHPNEATGQRPGIDAESSKEILEHLNEFRLNFRLKSGSKDAEHDFLARTKEDCKQSAQSDYLVQLK